MYVYLRVQRCEQSLEAALAFQGSKQAEQHRGSVVLARYRRINSDANEIGSVAAPRHDGHEADEYLTLYVRWSRGWNGLALKSDRRRYSDMLNNNETGISRRIAVRWHLIARKQM